MNNAAHAGTPAGREQRRRLAGVRGVGGIPRTVLQHTDAVDDGIHASKMRQPPLRLSRMAKIERHPAQSRRRSSSTPRQRDHFVALGR
jgi:hypothetical protein